MSLRGAVSLSRLEQSEGERERFGWSEETPMLKGFSLFGVGTPREFLARFELASHSCHDTLQVYHSCPPRRFFPFP